MPTSFRQPIIYIMEITAPVSRRAPLPPRIFDDALAEFQRVQELRIRRMYNRTRALFAEAVVATLLPGAKLVDDPGAAWDVTWKPGNDDLRVRIQVKCSGEFLPRKGPGYSAEPLWSFEQPKHGFDSEKQIAVGPGYHCDAFVLARHTGTEITAGWEFYVLRPSDIKRASRVTPAHLREMGAKQCTPLELAAAVQACALRG